MTPQAAFHLTEVFVQLGHIFTSMRHYGISINATPEALEAIRNCGHPDAFWVACNLMATSEEPDTE